MINYSIAIYSTKPGTKKENITETKAYAVSQVTDMITLDEFARHIADHGSKYKRGDIYAILAEAVDCLREQLLEGKKVSLGDLGSFSVRLKSEGATTASDLSAQHIKKVNVCWTKGKLFKNLREDAEFQCVPSRKAAKDALTAERAKETMQSEENSGGNDGGNDGGNSID